MFSVRLFGVSVRTTFFFDEVLPTLGTLILSLFPKPKFFKEFWQSLDLFCCPGENFQFPPNIVFPVRPIFRVLSGQLFSVRTNFFVKLLKYLCEQRYPLTSPYSMTKRITYYSNTTGGRTTLTAGGEHRGHLPKNFRLQNPRNCPNRRPDRKKGPKSKDRMSVLRPLFLSESTRSTLTHRLPSPAGRGESLCS